MINDKLPVLRFPECSELCTYSTYQFEEIFNFSSGKNIKQNEASPDFKIPCVRYGELYHLYGEVITRVINRTNLDSTELTFSIGNEILLPSAGEDPLDIGSASALTLKGIAIGRTINVLRPKGAISYSPIYISFYINEKLKRKISTLARGASISNVYNSDLKGLKINLPCIDEQQKVASFLNSVDMKTNLLKKKYSLLTQYKKGMLQKLFKQEVRFKDEGGNNFPCWKNRKFGDFISVRKESPSEEDNSPLASLTIENGIEAKSSRYIRDFLVNDESDAYKLVFPNDFVSNPMNLRFGAIAKNNSTQTVKISKYYDVFYIDGSVDKSYFELFLKSHEMFKKYHQTATGTLEEKKRVHFSEFVDFVKPLPCIEEQKKISAFVSALDKKLEAVKQQIELTQTFKKGLLQQMFV